MSEAFEIGVRRGMEKTSGQWGDRARKASHTARRAARETMKDFNEWNRRAVNRMSRDLSPSTGDAVTGLAMRGAVEGLGGAVGHHYGGAQRERGERYGFGVPQALGVLFLPGGAGYQIGRYMAHKKKTGEQPAKKEK